MPYIADRLLQLGTEDGQLFFRSPGEHVPEADQWRNIRPWVDGKFVHLASEEDVDRTDLGRQVANVPATRPTTRKQAQATTAVEAAHDAVDAAQIQQAVDGAEAAVDRAQEAQEAATAEATRPTGRRQRPSRRLPV